MAVLPQHLPLQPGNWNPLNDFLSVGHNSDGTLKNVRAVYNAKDDPYGAKGDWNGSAGTDDAAAIQAALTAAAVTGGVVYLPTGSYKITAGLTIGSNVTLAGAGMGSSILVPQYAVAGSPNNVIKNDWVNGNTNIGLVDFSIQRTAAGNAQHAILLNGLDGYYIDRVRVYGTPQALSGCISISAIGPATPLLSQRGIIGVVDLRDTTNFGLQVGYINGLTISQILGDNAYRELFGIEPTTGATAENIAVGRILGKGAAVAGGTATGAVIVTNSSGGTVGSGIEFGDIVYDGGTSPIASDTSPGLFIRGVTDGLSIDSLTVRRANGAGAKIGAAGATTQGVLIGRAVILSCNQGGNASPDSVGLAFRGATSCGWGEAYIHGAAHTASVEETSSAAAIQHGRLQSLDTKRYNTIAVTSSISEDRAVAPAFPGAGGAVSPDLGDGNNLTITVTDATAFTINSPPNHTQGRTFTLDILNSSGGAMGAVTFGPQYKLAGVFTVPLNTKRRTITFRDTGTNCIEIGRAAADI